MRRNSISCILALAAVLMTASLVNAMNYEAHPGLYTSYEYSDNYFGTSRDEKTEGFFEVGPSLELRATAPNFTGDITGRVARSLHNRYDEDDSTEASVASHATLTELHQTFGLSYAYLQTRRREALSEPAGEVKTHTGAATYSRALTPGATLSLGYDITDESRQAPYEDETSQGGNIGLTYLFTPRNTIDLTCSYLDHDYEISQDVKETAAGVSWSQTATVRLRYGLRSAYTQEDRGDLPGEYRYDLSAFGTYSVAQHTSLSASGGQSWLVMEHQDRETIYTTSATLEYAVERDRLAISVSKGYTSEFTTTRYGTYDTRSATLTLEKGLLTTLTGSTELSVEKRKPTTGTGGEEYTDTSTRASLAWVPWAPRDYATVTATYEHLQTEYEISDTVRENRYRMIVEVRY